MENINLDELENINGGFSWRDVATGSGSALGGTIGLAFGPTGGAIGAIAGNAIGGAVYDWLT